ncbi:hypothetical protein [Curtobacterium aetherium]|uniref:Uncharacterized protein n=1 Tax=Curtobacterium aetherium TaxID=2841594 RepID=A0ACD1E496_9MICO|nr:hypothetical protein [Curtobacterium sp. L6-1]QWS33690.1 hypothetical protein KM842_00225 [Curtobacterium sp. L6-1]
MIKRSKSVPFAASISLALVAFGAVLMTAPATAGRWPSTAIAAVALFVAIVYTGAAICSRHRR